MVFVFGGRPFGTVGSAADRPRWKEYQNIGHIRRRFGASWESTTVTFTVSVRPAVLARTNVLVLVSPTKVRTPPAEGIGGRVSAIALACAGSSVLVAVVVETASGAGVVRHSVFWFLVIWSCFSRVGVVTSLLRASCTKRFSVRPIWRADGSKLPGTSRERT